MKMDGVVTGDYFRTTRFPLILCLHCKDLEKWVFCIIGRLAAYSQMDECLLLIHQHAQAVQRKRETYHWSCVKEFGGATEEKVRRGIEGAR